MMILKHFCPCIHQSVIITVDDQTIEEGFLKQRQAVYRMSREEGLTNEEISQKMGIQKKTVENHLNLALGDIRKMLKILILLLCNWG